jgi:hypothetical protein
MRPIRRNLYVLLGERFRIRESSERLIQKPFGSRPWMTSGVQSRGPFEFQGARTIERGCEKREGAQISSNLRPSASWPAILFERRSSRNRTEGQMTAHRFLPDSAHLSRSLRTLDSCRWGIEREEYERKARHSWSWQPPLLESLQKSARSAHRAGAESSVLKGLRKKALLLCIPYLVISG